MSPISLRSSPQEFYEGLENEEKFIQAVEVYHWGLKDEKKNKFYHIIPHCPKCKSAIITKMKSLKIPAQYQCNNKRCRRQFNIYIITPFFRSKTPLKKWFYIYWYQKRGLSINRISILTELRKRDVKSIIDKLLLKDQEDRGSYLFNISSDYKKYLGHR